MFSVKSAKAILIIYLGIFPILPGCLCQVLGAFGISLHEASLAGAECVMTDASQTIPCHCEEATSKAVEVPPSFEDELAWLKASTSHGEPIAGVFSNVVPTGLRGRPPPTAPNDWSCCLRTVSGVFRI